VDTLLAFAIAFAVTFYFVRNYLRNLTPATPSPSRGAPPAAGPADPCPRCGKPVNQGAAFCPSCGAPLELWKVHRAAVAVDAEAAGKKGKPKPVINASLCIGCGTCISVCPEEGPLALANGKAILANPEKCVGHAKCADACPTSALTLAYGDVVQTITVPLVNEEFETNVPGLFIVGELGGMGLIKTAINEGRLVIDHIRKRLNGGGANRSPTGEDGPVDVVIVGGGPAGLSASLTAKQHGMSYLTFEQGEVASTIRNYPRHKFLMAEPVEMPLYGSLYIADGSKEALLSVWETIIANTGVEIHTNERVESIVRRDGFFRVGTARRSCTARYVVLAMGKRGTPRRLGVPGEELGKVAYRLIEAGDYQDKDILVVGGGDSAVEAALALSRGKRNRVTLAYRKDDFSRTRERNREALLEAERKDLLTILRSTVLTEIRQTSVNLKTKEGPLEIPNQYVFIMIGGEPPEKFLQQIGVELVRKAVKAS